jgi:hypothetical protein
MIQLAMLSQLTVRENGGEQTGQLTGSPLFLRRLSVADHGFLARLQSKGTFNWLDSSVNQI